MVVREFLMTRCQKFIILPLLSISLSSLAGSIQVAQWLPWSFITQEIEQTPIHFDFHEPSLQLNFQGIKPVIKNLNIKVEGEIEKLNFDQIGIESTQNFQMQIHIGAIDIDQYIKREFGGNEIQVHIKANCSSFNISVEKLLTATRFIFIKESSLWRPELSDLQIDLDHKDWLLDEIRCTGINGIGSEISSLLSQNLNNPTVLQDLIKEILVQELRISFYTMWSSLLNTVENDLTITGIDKPRDKGVLITAALPIRKAAEVILPVVNEKELSTHIPQFLLSTKGFEALLEDKIMKLAPQAYNLQEVRGFNKLMRSRLKQQFVWPDLKRFPKDTPFYMSTNLDEFKLTLLPEAGNKWTANIQTNGRIETEIGTSKIDYILFGLGVSSSFNVAVEDSKLILTNGPAELQMYWDYGLIYQLIFNPNRHIGIDLLKGAIVPFFSHKNVMENLPTLKWGERELKLQNWNKKNDLISMDWL